MGNPAVQSPDQIRRLPRFRFSWGTGKEVRGEWRFGLFGYHIKGYPRELWILVSVRGLLCWGLGLTLAAYFAGTAGLALILARNPYNQVEYADLVLPTRWAQIRPRRALGFIDEGMHEYAQKNWGLALVYLQRGLAGQPGDLRARVSVARIYAGVGQVHRSLQLLREGLTYHGSKRQYLELLSQVTRYLDDYRTLLEVVDQVEAQLPPPEPALGRWLDGQRVLAWEKLGQPELILALRDRRARTPLIS
ncbi:MAG: tetratricopeptide repeat protein, partial [Opitutales bacterium]